MYHIGIDQSYTSCAVVVLEDGILLKATLIKSDPDVDVFSRAIDVADQIVAFVSGLTDSSVDLRASVASLGIEGLAFNMKGDATRDLAGLLFTIVNTIRYEICEPVIVSPQTVKKIAVKGGASKTEVVAALPQTVRDYFVDELGAKKTTGLEDLSDAYWVAVAAKDETNGTKASQFIKKGKKKKTTKRKPKTTSVS